MCVPRALCPMNVERYLKRTSFWNFILNIFHSLLPFNFLFVPPEIAPTTFLIVTRCSFFLFFSEIILHIYCGISQTHFHYEIEWIDSKWWSNIIGARAINLRCFVWFSFSNKFIWVSCYLSRRFFEGRKRSSFDESANCRMNESHCWNYVKLFDNWQWLSIWGYLIRW